LLLTLEQCAIIGRKSEVKSGVLAVSRQSSVVSLKADGSSKPSSEIIFTPTVLLFFTLVTR